MKKILIIALIFSSFSATAQKKEGIHFSVGHIDLKNTVLIRNDTLYVPAGSAKFIKVDDKVYKLVTTLEEVKENVGNSGIFFKGSSDSTYPIFGLPSNETPISN